MLVDLNPIEDIAIIRRRWPAIVGFAIAGLLVAFVVTGAFLRLRGEGSSSDPKVVSATGKPEESVRSGAPVTGDIGAAAASSSVTGDIGAAAGATSSPTSHVATPSRPPGNRSRSSVGAKQRAPARTKNGRPAARLEPRASGIPVDQIYVNSKGELVDAVGKPLSSGNLAQPGSPK